MINGRLLDNESTLSFKEQCGSLKDNFARQVIHEQIRYKAIELGIDKGISLDTIVFSKAAIWVINELEILLSTLANHE